MRFIKTQVRKNNKNDSRHQSRNRNMKEKSSIKLAMKHLGSQTMPHQQIIWQGKDIL